MRRSIPVTIAGQSYVLRSDADDDYVHEVVGLVDGRFRKVQRSTRQVATHKVAMLTALQLAGELLQERRRRAELRRKVRVRSQRMLELLTEAVGPGERG